MAVKLGVLAGAGELPLRVIEACRASGRPYFVLAFEGSADPGILAGAPHAWVRPGAAGRGLRLLRINRVEELVMVGAVRRPSLWSLRPDWRALRFYARIGLRALGDDGFLRSLIRELEGEGFRVIGVDSILSEALAPAGRIGGLAPDPSAETDIALGFSAARTLGSLDIGQAVIVQQGVVLGLEAAEGTDALIARCAKLQHAGPGGVLVKAAKPGQERRADLPAIGRATVEACAAAGLRGIAVEAGATLLINRAAIAQAADAAGLFVIGVTAP